MGACCRRRSTNGTSAVTCETATALIGCDLRPRRANAPGSMRRALPPCRTNGSNRTLLAGAGPGSPLGSRPGVSTRSGTGSHSVRGRTEVHPPDGRSLFDGRPDRIRAMVVVTLRGVPATGAALTVGLIGERALVRRAQRALAGAGMEGVRIRAGDG